MSTPNIPSIISDETRLEALLSEPSDPALKAMARIDGDVMLLGAGGKMGPTLAQMINRASAAIGRERRVIAVSRFSSRKTQQAIEARQVETRRGDLLDESFLRDLPDAPNVIFMTGRKFGSSEDAAATWAMNVYLPTLVCRRYRHSRILTFSTGNVYPLTPIDSGGSRESDPACPVGEYGMTALGRERMFEYFCRTLEIPTTLFRLNYAVELRYGVLVDIARQVDREFPVNLAMGHVNVIWQRDANAMALCALADAEVGPFVLNCCGPELVSIRDTAEAFGRLLGKPPRFVGEEQPTALLSNGSLGHERYGKPTVAVETLINWIAHWVKSGKPMFNKPTHFQTRDGRF